jgi:DNA-binding response OmpR family regulator
MLQETTPIEHPRLLVVDDESTARMYLPALSAWYEPAIVSTVAAAVARMRECPPSFVVTELDLPDSSGVMVCKASAELPVPPVVLVTTTKPERVPAAIAAGCDGVLLKPFAPNLLFARLGRLRRECRELRARSSREKEKARHLIERSQLVLSGTNRAWPSSHCPRCGVGGVVSFDNASYRRMWYACLGCEKVWIAPRLEELNGRAR